MVSRSARLILGLGFAAALPALAPALLLAARGASLKEEMKFGVEAAQRGLWREAIFRWEKVLQAHPDNAHLRNNLAVAYESLGQFDKAEEHYKEARRLDPDSKEIKNNYETFLEMAKSLRSRAPNGAASPPAAPGPAATPGPAPAPAPTPGSAPTPGPAATATPGPSGAGR